ncbi:type II toxin-antitoxin system PemK/MazF family toxin [uncultured Boseongicola sp.]|uniref:type II toxin-antitoxin system PemK/MazF family toxin n=1 Tax=uncultured Boseongicola sp. TaxID=1648499 RepID=UPI0026126E4F|nr:type II toxin-antitoxin system PemK/MazF family toxin [uncultured Boseongicola sp.]
MASLKPEVGLVIRYDFLFKEDRDRGYQSGKDRPNSIVVSARIQGHGDQRNLVVPITHTPPLHASEGIEVPLKIAHHLGLDDRQMWVKVNDMNSFTWEKGRIPHGVTAVSHDRQAYGVLPSKFFDLIKAAVLARAKN